MTHLVSPTPERRTGSARTQGGGSCILLSGSNSPPTHRSFRRPELAYRLPRLAFLSICLLQILANQGLHSTIQGMHCWDSACESILGLAYMYSAQCTRPDSISNLTCYTHQQQATSMLFKQLTIRNSTPYTLLLHTAQNSLAAKCSSGSTTTAFQPDLDHTLDTFVDGHNSLICLRDCWGSQVTSRHTAAAAATSTA